MHLDQSTVQGIDETDEVCPRDRSMLSSVASESPMAARAEITAKCARASAGAVRPHAAGPAGVGDPGSSHPTESPSCNGSGRSAAGCKVSGGGDHNAAGHHPESDRGVFGERDCCARRSPYAGTAMRPRRGPTSSRATTWVTAARPRGGSSPAR